MVKKISEILELLPKLGKADKIYLLQQILDEMFKDCPTNSRKRLEQDIEQVILNMLDKHIGHKEVLVFLGNIATKYVDRHPELKKDLEKGENTYVS